MMAYFASTHQQPFCQIPANPRPVSHLVAPDNMAGRGLSPARARLEVLASVAVATAVHVQRGVQAQASCCRSRIEILQECLGFRYRGDS